MNRMGEIDITETNTPIVEKFEEIRTEFNKINVIDDSSVRNARFNVLLRELQSMLAAYTEIGCEYIVENFYRDSVNSYFTKAYMYCLCMLVKNGCKLGAPYFVIGYLMVIAYLPMKIKCTFISANKFIMADWFLNLAYKYGDMRSVECLEIYKWLTTSDQDFYRFSPRDFEHRLDEMYEAAVNKGHSELLIPLLNTREKYKEYYNSCEVTSNYTCDLVYYLVENIKASNPSYLSVDSQRVIKFVEDNYEKCRKVYVQKRIITLLLVVLAFVAYIVFTVISVKQGLIWPTVTVAIIFFWIVGLKSGVSVDDDSIIISIILGFFFGIYIAIKYVILDIVCIIRRGFKREFLYNIWDYPGMDKISYSDNMRNSIYTVIH